MVRATWLLLSACSGSPPPCDDLPCQTRAMVATWDLDPAAATAQIAAMADPALRAALVEGLVEARPGRTGELCALVEAGPGRQRCEAIQQRPHLWLETPQEQAAFSGEAERILAPGTSARAAEPVEVLLPDCGELGRHGCLAQAAAARAAAGDHDAAHGLCAAIDTPRWQGECHFQVVEQGCRAGQLERCAPLALLCLAAGPFRTPCLVQVAGELARIAPPAEAPGASGWSQLDQQIVSVEASLAERDPDLARRFADRTWAEAMVVSYAGAREVSGGPLAHIAASRLPHARAAAAWRLAVQGELRGDLSTRVLAVQAALGRTGRRADAQSSTLTDRVVQGAWSEDLPGEDALPWVAFLQDARRTVGQDEAADLRIVLLELAARQEPPEVALLTEGLLDEDVRVRWTAARLLGGVDPEATALAAAREDVDPLVRRRALGG